MAVDLRFDVEVEANSFEEAFEKAKQDTFREEGCGGSSPYLKVGVSATTVLMMI